MTWPYVCMTILHNKIQYDQHIINAKNHESTQFIHETIELFKIYFVVQFLTTCDYLFSYVFS